MRWAQVLLSAAAAVLTGYVTYLQSFGLVGSVSISVITYICLRWVIAWLFRMQYWYKRDGIHSTHCGNCGQYIYRLSGDFIPQCKRCGEKQGFPVTRLFTRSVAAVQLRRTVYGPLVLFVLISGLVLSGIAIGAFDDPDISEISEMEWSDISDESSDSNGLGEGITEDAEEDSSGFNEDTAREYLVAELNQKRQNRGLNELQSHEALYDAAYSHSEEMVARNFFDHTNPDGVGVEQRISETTLECRYTGENIAVNHWDENVIGSDRIESNADLAEVIIQQWIDSPPHRENLFRAEWDYVAHGISFDGDEFYVTQKFCGV